MPPKKKIKATKSKSGKLTLPTKKLAIKKPSVPAIAARRVAFAPDATSFQIINTLVADAVFRATFDLATRRRVNEAVQGLRDLIDDRNRAEYDLQLARIELVELRALAKPVKMKSALAQALDDGLLGGGSFGDPPPGLTLGYPIKSDVDADEPSESQINHDSMLESNEPEPDESEPAADVEVDTSFDPATFADAAANDVTEVGGADPS